MKTRRILFSFWDSLWQLVYSRTGLIIVGAVLFAAASVVSSALFLKVNSDQDTLVSPELPFQKRYLDHLRNFGDQEYLYIVIQTPDSPDGPARSESFADALAARLDEHPELIRELHYRISPTDLGEGALLYASMDEARATASMLSLVAPRAQDWAFEQTLPLLLDNMSGLLDSGSSGNAADMADMLQPALANIDGLLAAMERASQGELPDDTLFSLEEMGATYFHTGDNRFLVMRILPEKDFSSMDVVGDSLRIIRADLDQTRAEFPDMEAGLTGRPALHADEMSTTDKDMTRASIAAFILVGLMFMLVLHGWLRPALVLATLLLAMAWTFGFTLLAVGELNLLSMVFILVLVGIGVDFGIHIVARFVEASKRGYSPENAVKRSLFHTGPGILLGALTSVCAFYAVVWSDFSGLADLGLIGGTGVILCLAAMLTVLPAMLLLAGRKKLFRMGSARLLSLPFMEGTTRRPRLVLLGAVLLSLALSPGLSRVGFNYNLLDLQARGLESVEYEHLLLEASDESTWFSIMTAGSMDQVRDLSERLSALERVGRVESILDLIPTDQADKIALYKPLAPAYRRAASVAASVGDPVDFTPQELATSLVRFQDRLYDLEELLFSSGATDALATLTSCLDRIDTVLGVLESMPPDTEGLRRNAAYQSLNLLQLTLSRNLRRGLEIVATWLGAEEVGPQDLPYSLRNLYIGRDGAFQLKITPVGDLWDHDNLSLFVEDLRHIDPEVSGVPVVFLESTDLMRRTFLYAAAATLVLVALILFIYSRSIRYVMLTLLPLTFGMLWLLEVMGLLGIRFNLANFFAIPILISIGVDGGVHLLHRWEELPLRTGLFSTSTPTAVCLSFATTMIGFGGLLFAHHRGMASLGALMVLGSLTGMLACIIILPPALRLFGKKDTA